MIILESTKFNFQEIHDSLCLEINSWPVHLNRRILTSTDGKSITSDKLRTKYVKNRLDTCFFKVPIVMFFEFIRRKETVA